MSAASESTPEPGAAAAADPVPEPDPPRLRLGVSACLLGEAVRYDGGHKRDRFLADLLGRFVDWVPVCPEVEVDLGTPRPAMRLVEIGGAGGVRLLAPATGADHTAAMERYAARRAAELAAAGLSGYVLKRGSPSCGLDGIEIDREAGEPPRPGRGLFAAALVAALPELPVEEEGRLADPRRRESFVAHALAYERFRRAAAAGWTRAALQRFHARHKLLLMARSPAGLRRLGRMIGGQAGAAPRDAHPAALAAGYLAGMTEVLRRPATRRGHTNALHHAAGYVSDGLDRGERAELAGAIERYRLGEVPRSVPLALLRRHVRRQEVAYLAGQVYLDPHPAEQLLHQMPGDEP